MGEQTYTLQRLDIMNYREVPLCECVRIYKALSQDMEKSDGERLQVLRRIEQKLNRHFFGEKIHERP